MVPSPPRATSHRAATDGIVVQQAAVGPAAGDDETPTPGADGDGVTDDETDTDDAARAPGGASVGTRRVTRAALL